MPSNKEDTDMGAKLMEILGSSINFKGLADDWYIKHQEDTAQIKQLFLDTLNTKLDGLDMGEILDKVITRETHKGAVNRIRHQTAHSIKSAIRGLLNEEMK